MSGRIELNMAFGSYDKSIAELKQKYVSQNRSNNDNNLESDYVFFEKGSRRVMGNAYREKIQKTPVGYKYSDAILFKDGLMFGASSITETGLDTFDFIQSKDKYAIDINGNGKVDAGELFEGELNRQAYKEAKVQGSLAKYSDIIKKYSY